MDDTTKKAEELAAAEAEAQAAEEAARAAMVKAQMARQKADQAKAGQGGAPEKEPVPEPPVQEDWEEDDYEDDLPPKKKKKHTGLVVLCVVLAILVAAGIGTYVFFNGYFKDHFFIRTVINGEDVSFKNASEVRNALAEKAIGYDLEVVGRNGLTTKLSGKDLGMIADDGGAVDRLLQDQEGKNWFLAMFQPSGGDVEMTLSVDEAVLERTVAALPEFDKENVKEPVNATLDTSGKTCVLVPEDEGAKPDKAKVLAAVKSAANAKAPVVDLDAEDCYEHPIVKATDETLLTRQDAWNKLLSADVTYVFGENKERVTGEDARSHIIDDGQTVKLDNTFAHDLVYAWGRKYDTFGLAREFKTTSGEIVTIPYGGDYGWCSNKEKTIADLENALLSGATGEREPIWLFRAMGWDNNDLTGTYVEVSIDQQHLWCYKDGQLIVDTPVVTGSLAEPDTPTQRGCFAIDAKVTDKVLGALDTQGYANPVSFWMPFDGGRGLHDAPWRDAYGGNIYVTNGSHGCVNIPYDKMAVIYNNLQIGHAVVVY